MTTSVRMERHSGCFGVRTRFSCVAAPRDAAGEARWTGQASLTINRRSRPLAPGSAQVAQLVEHATENRSVGGSIPPLGTRTFYSQSVGGSVPVCPRDVPI